MLTQKPFPGFERIYVLDDPLGNAFRGEVVLPIQEMERLARCFLGEEEPPWWVPIRWAMGKREPGDLIFTTTLTVIAVHERVVNLLQEHGFSGWKIYPVYVVGKDPADSLSRYPNYHGLAITGRCGPLDYTSGTPVRKQMPGGVYTYWRGVRFDPSTWDSSDLFVPDDSLRILVTEEVKGAFERAKVRNVRFERLTEFEVDELILRASGIPIPEKRQ